jgi:hypothetical protein
MALFRRKGGNGAALEEAREALAATNDRIQELSRRRERLLLGDDDIALEAIDAELDKLERLARRDADRVRLIEDQARREEAERIAKRQQDLIGRNEKKLHESDTVAAEVQN